MTAAFLLTTLIVCLAPGIGIIYTLSMTLGGGLRAGMLAVVGCTLATVVHLVAAWPAGGGAAYLCGAVPDDQMGRGGLSAVDGLGHAARHRHAGRKGRGPGAALRIIRRGITLNILNPKIPIFFMAFLPQFVTPGDDGTAQLIQLGAVFVAMTAGVFTLYALLAGTMRARVLSSERAMAWLRRAFAASFAALGLKLAFERA